MASTNSCYSLGSPDRNVSLPKGDEGRVKVLCQTSEQAMKRIENCRVHRDKFLADLKQLPEEQNRRLEVLRSSVNRFEESVYSGRLANARNRDSHMATIKKLCAYLEADPQQKVDLDKLETEVNRLLEQVIAVHREYYQFERRFDAEDMLSRVHEMGNQVSIVEETFAKSQTQPPTPADAILLLSSPTAKDEADLLIARLKEFST